MTWAKYGTEFGDEAAAAGLSDAAFRTHAEGIAWCYRMSDTEKRVPTRIRFPKHLLPRFAASPDRDLAVKELLGLGWWKDAGDDWEIIHHSAVITESIRAQRRARDGNRERQRRHREKASREGPGVTRDIPRDITRDPEQSSTENHPRAERDLGPRPETTRKTGGRRYSRGAA